MSKKTKTTSQSTQTTTPNNPTWVTQGLESVGGALQGLMGRDPKSFVAGPSALQSKVFQDATGLTSSPFFGQAGDIFGKVAGAGANTYDFARAGQAHGYDAARAGQAQGYDAARAGQAQGYDAAQAAASSYTASSGLEGLDKYMSPYTGQVVDAALADFDYGAGQTRANQALEEARSGAFGGSGAAIGRSLTEGELARGRATTSANLRDLGFTRGAGLSFQDAAARNQAAQFNADAQMRAALANAQAQNEAAQFGASARNQFSLADQQALNEAAQFGAAGRNQFSLADQQAANQAAQFGASARNQFSLADQQAANQAGQFNAQAMDAALARQLSAGGALADLGQATGADQRANLALQGTLGADQQAIDQALAQAPLSVLQQIAGTYGGLPLNLLRGETTTGSSSSTSKTSDPIGAIATLGSLALAPFTGGLSLGALGGLGAAKAGAMAAGKAALSDRRLKTDIEKIGEREDGLGVYAFRYLWSPARFIGVMAQEVLNVKPEAVIHLPGGYMAVNYGAL